jgi:hypothetical protein
MKNRAGAPNSGTVAAEGTGGDVADPRIILFHPPVSPCIVTCHNAAFKGHEISVKVNEEINGTCVSPFTQAAGLGHFVLPVKRTEVNLFKDPPEAESCHEDVSCGGQLAVHSVSFTGMGDLTSVSVVGFDG